MKDTARSSLHFMLGKLYKPSPLGNQTKTKITGYMDEGVEICGHVFGTSRSHIYIYLSVELLKRSRWVPGPCLPVAE